MYDGQKVEKIPDAALPRFGARVTYFSLAIVRQLEKMGVLMLNKIESLEISRDKLYTTQTRSLTMRTHTHKELVSSYR